MHRRNLLVALIALLVALPLTACSARLPDPATAVKAATLNASEGKTVRFEITTEYEGVEDAEFELDVPVEGAIDLDRSAFRMGMSFERQDFEWRFVDGKSYMRMFDDQWMELETSEAEDMFGSFILFDPEDPFSPLEDFGAKGSQLARDGEEEIRGRQTTRYAGTVAVDDLTGDLYLDSETDEILFELWIDEENLPARFRMSYEFEADELLFDSIAGETPRVVFTMEYFDWGEPVDIEAPPADQIMDIDDDPFGGGSFGDPFEGADCYDDRVDNCLGVNAELDARASDPALCQGAEARVCLVPVGKVRTDVVDAIVKFHKDTANIDVLVLPSLPLDADSIYRDTSQVDADTLYEMLQEHYGVGDRTPSTFVAITPIDVKPRDDEYGWMFGSRWGSGPNGHNHGVFSYFRMVNVEPYDGTGITDELIHRRASRYVGRYVALLHLDYPIGDDIEYLNYSDMYGFSDLDSIGENWPTGPRPCEGDEPIICIVPDGDYLDFEFPEDLELAAERLSADLGIRVEMRNANTSYYPTEDSWSDEYRNDLNNTMGVLLQSPNITVIGVTDDALSQSASVPHHVDKVWLDERLAIVSGWDAGVPGTGTHQNRLYKVLLRAIARVHFGKPLNSDPSSLLFEGVSKPPDLDEKTAPALP